ncbi:MAG TPA: cell division protein SepF [Syntrophomonadaceae bacterium]|nr:cell division protein SepF [Syntrophomonadaceae bacterium]
MGMLDKFWGWLGIQNEEDEEEFNELPVNIGQDNKKNIANVVSIHTNKTMKVVVCEPEKFDEVQMLSDHLRNRKQLIINFENTPEEISQRIIDFLSGSTYSLDGDSQQIGPHIFIFTPSNVEINRDNRSILRKHSFSNTNVGGER